MSTSQMYNIYGQIINFKITDINLNMGKPLFKVRKVRKVEYII